MHPVNHQASGHKGTITFDGDAVVVEPEWQFRDEFIEKTGSSKVYVEIEPHNAVEEHHDNFLSCIRSRKLGDHPMPLRRQRQGADLQDPKAIRRALPDYLPARMINELVYCPRMFY